MKIRKHLIIILVIGLFMTACGPKVVSTDPCKTCESPWYTTVNATFNQNINPATVNSTTFKVEKDGSPVPGTIMVSGKTVTFMPTSYFDVPHPYTVTLTKGIKNTSGFAMQKDYSWPFTTEHGWKNPKNIDDNISPNGTGAYLLGHIEGSESIVTNEKNDAIITWRQEGGGSYDQIFKSEYHNGIWTHPSGLSDTVSPDGTKASEPRVGLDNEGNAIIVWRQYVGQPDASSYHMFKRERHDGVWEPKPSLTDYFDPGISSGNSSFVMSSGGDAVFSYGENLNAPSGRSRLFASEYRDGVWNHLGPDDYINPDGPDWTENGNIAINANGDTIITWYQPDASGIYQTFKSEYRNGVWIRPLNLSDNISPDGWDVSFPMVAIADNDDAIIVWQQYDGISNVRIFKYEYRSGSWSGPTSISPVGTSADFPHVAMDANGNAIITWTQIDESGYSQCFKSEYRNGVWTHPSSISDHISLDGTEVFGTNVAMDSSGSAIITWYQKCYKGYIQVFKCEKRNGSWICPTGLSDHLSPDGSDTVAHSYFSPVVAMDGKGNAIIAWSQYDSDHFYQVFKSEYR